MPEQTCDSTPPPGPRTRLTAPGSGLALCGLSIRGPRHRPFPRAAGPCPQRPIEPREIEPDQGTSRPEDVD